MRLTTQTTEVSKDMKSKLGRNIGGLAGESFETGY
jgi:hypothetical protein